MTCTGVMTVSAKYEDCDGSIIIVHYCSKFRTDTSFFFCICRIKKLIQASYCLCNLWKFTVTIWVYIFVSVNIILCIVTFFLLFCFAEVFCREVMSSRHLAGQNTIGFNQSINPSIN